MRRILDLDKLQGRKQTAWERLKNNREKYTRLEWRKQYNKKRRQNQNQNQNQQQKTANSSETAIVLANGLRRESILMEMMNQLFSIEWVHSELPDVWAILKHLRSLADRNGTAA